MEDNYEGRRRRRTRRRRKKRTRLMTSWKGTSCFLSLLFLDLSLYSAIRRASSGWSRVWMSASHCLMCFQYRRKYVCMYASFLLFLAFLLLCRFSFLLTCAPSLSCYSSQFFCSLFFGFHDRTFSLSHPSSWLSFCFIVSLIAIFSCVLSDFAVSHTRCVFVWLVSWSWWTGSIHWTSALSLFICW